MAAMVRVLARRLNDLRQAGASLVHELAKVLADTCFGDFRRDVGAIALPLPPAALGAAVDASGARALAHFDAHVVGGGGSDAPPEVAGHREGLVARMGAEANATASLNRHAARDGCDGAQRDAGGALDAAYGAGEGLGAYDAAAAGARERVAAACNVGGGGSGGGGALLEAALRAFDRTVESQRGGVVRREIARAWGGVLSGATAAFGATWLISCFSSRPLVRAAYGLSQLALVYGLLGASPALGTAVGAICGWAGLRGAACDGPGTAAGEFNVLVAAGARRVWDAAAAAGSSSGSAAEVLELVRGVAAGVAAGLDGSLGDTFAGLTGLEATVAGGVVVVVVAALAHSAYVVVGGCRRCCGGGGGGGGQQGRAAR